MERKCKNCSTHDDFTGACFCPESEHRADFTSGDFVCNCHTWDSDTIKQAFSIAREAILTEGKIRKGFLASIESEITESKFLIAHPKESIHKFAERILQRIAGWKE